MSTAPTDRPQKGGYAAPIVIDTAANPKRVAEAHLPRDIVYRHKMGFAVPPEYYLGAWPDRWVREGFVTQAFGIDPDQLREWIAEQTSQTGAWMLTLEIWGQLFMQGRAAAEVSDEYLSTP